MTSPTPEIGIRATTADDVQRLLTLIAPFVAKEMLLPRTTEEMTTLAENGFVAETDGDLIGFAAIEIYSKKLAEIQCLAVADGYQRAGIGRSLVQRCVARAREKGIQEVMAITADEGFLRECGFDYALPNQKKALFYHPSAAAGDIRPPSAADS